MHFSSDAGMIYFEILSFHGNKFAAFASSEDFLTSWLLDLSRSPNVSYYPK